MKSKKVDWIHKHFSEPFQFMGRWIMVSKYKDVENIECKKYSECYDTAEAKLRIHFKNIIKEEN